LLEEYPKTPYAAMASLFMGKQHVDEANYDEALKDFSWVIDNSNVEEFKLVALARKARVHIGQDQYDKALAILNVEDGDGFVPVLEELKGDIYLKQGEKEKAKLAYMNAFEEIQAKQLEHPLLKLKLQELGADIESETNP
jgi:predicted negative regulator of RcsB-dependent stress response